MKQSRIILILFIIISFFSINITAKAEGFDPDNYAVFFPTETQTYAPRPVIIGFSPSGNGKDVINIWKEAAEENNCAIIASNKVRNGKDIQAELLVIKKDLNEYFSKEYPIDMKKVIAVGSSGGGMASHLFSFLHPDTVSAVISNVGYIHEGTLSQSKIYPQNKICAFLAGTTDYNYKLMKEDLKFLQNHGWACKWIEFVGGHVMAPQEQRKEALKFVLDELEKREQASNQDN